MVYRYRSRSVVDRRSVRIWFGTPAIAEASAGLTRSPTQMPRILPRLGPDRFLSNPFHFITTKLSSFRPTPYRLDSDSVVKQPTKKKAWTQIRAWGEVVD
jgi:hypothetical protein